MAQTLEPFDLETLRLGYYDALRIIRDTNGKFVKFSVVGRPEAGERISRSIQKLIDMRLAEAQRFQPRLIEARVFVTDYGLSIYRQFIDNEEAVRRKIRESME